MMWSKCRSSFEMSKVTWLLTGFLGYLCKFEKLIVCFSLCWASEVEEGFHNMISYQIYQIFSDSVPASERTYTIKDLPSAMYSLWVTASTAKGEGPKGQRSKVKFFIQCKQLPWSWSFGCNPFCSSSIQGIHTDTQPPPQPPLATLSPTPNLGPRSSSREDTEQF